MTVSSTSGYWSEILFRMKQERRRREPLEIQLEYLPEEQCRAVSRKEDYCILRYGHPGPCSWRKRKP